MGIDSTWPSASRQETPRLHVFVNAADSLEPLFLERRHWEALRTAQLPTRVVAWACGDHMAEVQTEFILSADSAGVHLLEERFACTDSGHRGERLPEGTRESALGDSP